MCKYKRLFYSETYKKSALKDAFVKKISDVISRNHSFVSILFSLLPYFL